MHSCLKNCSAVIKFAVYDTDPGDWIFQKLQELFETLLALWLLAYYICAGVLMFVVLDAAVNYFGLIAYAYFMSACGVGIIWMQKHGFIMSERY